MCQPALHTQETQKPRKQPLLPEADGGPSRVCGPRGWGPCLYRNSYPRAESSLALPEEFVSAISGFFLRDTTPQAKPIMTSASSNARTTLLGGGRTPEGDSKMMRAPSPALSAGRPGPGPGNFPREAAGSFPEHWCLMGGGAVWGGVGWAGEGRRGSEGLGTEGTEGQSRQRKASLISHWP